MKGYKGSKQQLVWTHNSHIGCAVMMQKQAQAIMRSPTASPTARLHAATIYANAIELEQALRTERKS